MEKLDLTHIHTVPDKMTAELVKGFLESNGVKVMIRPNPGPEGAFMGTYGGSAPFNPWLIYVPKNQIEKAKEILKDFDKNRMVKSPGCHTTT